MLNHLFSLVTAPKSSRSGGCGGEASRLDIGSIESLESRKMLAGDVDVFLNSAGDVRIIGDNAANQVGVYRTPTNLLLVQGQNGTTITHNGITSNMLFLDAMNSTGEVRRNVTVDLNDGFDYLDIDGVNIAGNLRVQMDGGQDAFDFRNSIVSKNATINGGGGLDGDEINMQASSVIGNLRINMGAGTSPGGFGVEATTLNQVYVGRNLSIVGSANHQTIQAANLIVEGNTRMNTGSGSDYVRLENSYLAGRLNVVAGSGNDYVGIGASVFDEVVNVNMGSGNDVLQELSSVTYHSAARYNGGSGEDDVTRRFGTSNTRSDVRFELFIDIF